MMAQVQDGCIAWI